MKLTRNVLILAVALLLATVAVAQQTGGLTIRVTDAQGALPGAIITLSNTQGKIKTTQEVTNKDGEVYFPVLMAGSGYVLEVSFPGKATQRLDLQVKINQNQVIPVQLTDQFTETVKVIEQRDVIDLDEQEQSAKFSDEFISDLPVQGRFYQNVLTLAPGVQDPDGDGNPNVHGSRSRDFKAMVSGVSNVDPLSGQQLANVNPNSIEEMEVITAGAGPEVGRAQGGFANIIQKQGGNNHEGVFDFLYRSSQLDGDGANNRPADRQPSFDWLQPSLQFSGPIVRDKLWYRLSHEIIDIEDPVDTVNTLEVVKTKSEINSDQITWQVSDRNKLAFRYDANPTDVSNAGVSSLTPSESTLFQSFDTETFNITWSAPYSPQLFVESLVAFQDAGLTVRPTLAGQSNDCVTGLALFENAQCFNADTGETSGSFNVNYLDDRQRFTVKSDATLFLKRKLLGMTHELKFGMVVENERFSRTVDTGASVFFFTIDPADEDQDTGEPEEVDPIGFVISTFAVPSVEQSKATGATWGAYFRDTMKPMQNMTISWGGRLEREIINANGLSPIDPAAEFAQYNDLLPTSDTAAEARVQAFTIFEGQQQFENELKRLLEANDVGVLFGPISGQARFQVKTRRAENIQISNTNFSPFLAFSWDPWSNNKTRFGFTAGRNYNNIPLAIPMAENQTTAARVASRAERVNGVWVADSIGDAGKINPAASLQTVRRDLRTPYQDELTATFERELWDESRMKVVYIKREYRDQLQDIDINNAPGDFGSCFPQGGLNTETGPDGIIDDCTGRLIAPAESDIPPDPLTGAGLLDVPDGVPDLYTLNPFWGPIYEIGNYNEADYQAFVLEFVRRQYRGWEMQGSYTWSEATGNGEDFAQDVGDDQSLVDDEFGFQSNDQRHVVKFAGTTITPWNFRLGGTVIWQSGLPYSLQTLRFSRDTTPPSLGSFGSNEPRQRFLFPTGVRNDQRNSSYWTFNLKATKEMSIGRRMNLMLSAEIFNLLNEGTYKVYNRFRESGRQINGNNEAFREFGRRFQLSVKASF